MSRDPGSVDKESGAKPPVGFASALRATSVRRLIWHPALCRDYGLGDAPPRDWLSSTPRGPRCRSGF